MKIISDVINVNKSALNKTFKNLKYIPLLALVILGLTVAEFWVQTLLSGFDGGINFLLGFARYIVSIVFGAALIGILYDLVLYNRFRINGIIDGYKTFFGPFSSVMFPYVLLEYVFLFLGTTSSIFNMIGTLILFGIMSLLYEEVYIANNYGVEAYSHILSFLKENILHWIIPLVFYVFLHYRMQFVGLAIFNISYLVQSLVYSLLLAFIYLYKGYLFTILYNSSRRKREFEGMF